MSTRLAITGIFSAVGLGALTVTLLRDPAALVPHPPYGPWIFARILALCSIAALGLLLVLGVVDDLDVFDEADRSLDRAMAWRAIGLAFLISVLATATFVAVSALVNYLDRVFF